MEPSINITSISYIRVLLIPVGPLKKTTFFKHVKLVKEFSELKLGDVTPDMKKGAGAMFSSQVFQEGQLHFQFLTSYSRDHAFLEDFQMQRRVFGVIGIMDCQEWKDGDLSQGYTKFLGMLEKYPTAIATRCFAFDPNENQPDTTKGLIMIPNVGNMSFYMSTMICDFASELLSEFSTLVSIRINVTVMLLAYYKNSPLAHRLGTIYSHRAELMNCRSFATFHTSVVDLFFTTKASAIEQRVYIESPNPFNLAQSPSIPPQGFNSASSISIKPPTPLSINPPDISPKSPTSVGIIGPAPTASFSSTFMKRAVTAPNRGATLTVTSEGSPTPGPGAITRSFSSSNLSGPLSPLPGDARLRKRTPGRIVKLIADLYLLSGRLPDAVNSYNQAIDITRNNSDYIWLASAMEGLVCSTLLLEYLHADIGIISRRPNTPPDPPGSPMKEQAPPPNSPKPTLVDIPEKYFTILSYYAKNTSSQSTPTPPIIYIEGCLKVARFLATVYRCGGWGDKTLGMLTQGKVLESNNNDMADGINVTASKWEQSLKSKNSGVLKYDIAGWVMRAWTAQVENLSTTDQIHVTTAMASLLSVVGYRRKHAFLLRQSVLMILPLLIQTRTAMGTNPVSGHGAMGQNSVNGGTNANILKADMGVLGCLREICEVYGIRGQGDEEEDFKEGDDRDFTTSFPGGALHQSGWPKLQIDILRECITISEALPGNLSSFI
ncbi:transport protein Trs120 or TRAPPC9 TRAPP II complex subunit-domain-containing protein [Jimgerdemannia flammicorona]|uniref:Transport protein Trs120 or TRAPPC9 TRAPP II complex subunit-domain-containing protein n=1 Tax=Jimgerdemannia flammicorona TaxID=994334 RepID=A0A433Q388_9FUNG|nr:transport protein Trs120 or TRAPPC9 TRAPP II complex subunit-domain-containing protein [Jimgerdemannia flammicorona]